MSDILALLTIFQNIFSYDWVAFYDGNDATAPLLGCGKKWCQFTPPMITSSDNFLLIKFHSDVGYEYSGFEILYEAGEMIFATSHENQAIEIGCFIKTSIFSSIISYCKILITYLCFFS